MNWLKQRKGVLGIEFMPGLNSPLRIESDVENTVFVRCDSIMGAYLATYHEWEIDEPLLYKQITKDLQIGSNRTLIDIGANVGLFTRGCLNTDFDQVSAYCYEPDPLNYKYLNANLTYLNKGQLQTYNAGIHTCHGSANLYLDDENTGNYSINPNSLKSSVKKHIPINILDVREECERWILSGKKIFYKSDTQGNCETIVARIPSVFWQNVYAGIIELRRIKGKEVNIEPFARMLDCFKYKSIDFFGKQKFLNTKQILYFCQGHSDYRDLNLKFWN